jgi:hypothetical protein
MPSDSCHQVGILELLLAGSVTLNKDAFFCTSLSSFVEQEGWLCLLTRFDVRTE